MRTFKLFFTVMVLCMLAMIPDHVYSQDMDKKALKEQKKKEKAEQKALAKANEPPFDWFAVRPEKLSGTEDMKNMDEYILYCDTIWTRVQEYKEGITFFSVDTFETRLENGEPGYVVKIVDQEGNPRNFSRSFRQGLDLTLTGTNLLLDAALITTMGTNAGLDLVSNPLATFTYGKAVKAAPKLLSTIYAEVKEIVAMKKQQSAEIKALNGSKLEGSTDQAYILAWDENAPLPENMDNLPPISEIDLGNSDGEIFEGMDDIDLDIPELSLD